MKDDLPDVGKQLVKRTWVYSQYPSVFDVSPCSCGNTKTEWSEYKDHLWCSVCQLDFVPTCWGIFDGPIPIRVAGLLGITFNKYCLLTNKHMIFNHLTSEYTIKEEQE